MAITDFLDTGKSPIHLMAFSPILTGSLVHCSVRVDYVSATSERPLYVGHSPSGNVAASDWDICRFTYDADNRVTAVQYTKNCIWNNRTGATYY